jgi:hypothetical protein
MKRDVYKEIRDIDLRIDLRCLKSKYPLDFSARWVSRHVGKDVSNPVNSIYGCAIYTNNPASTIATIAAGHAATVKESPIVWPIHISTMFTAPVKASSASFSKDNCLP